MSVGTHRRADPVITPPTTKESGTNQAICGRWGAQGGTNQAICWGVGWGSLVAAQGDVGHLLAGNDLDALAALNLAGVLLMGVEDFPVLPLDHGHAARLQ